MALEICKNLVSSQYLENKLTDFHQILYMHSYWHDLAWDCNTSFFHICSSVMALDLHQNFVSVQYLENKLTDFHQILYMHSYWQDLLWDCYTFFAHLYQSYGPWFAPKFLFPSLSWEQIDRISPNFIYAFILTRSTLGLLHIIFCTFVPVLWPLIYAKILFLLNILRTNGQNFTKFYICIHNIDKI